MTHQQRLAQFNTRIVRYQATVAASQSRQTTVQQETRRALAIVKSIQDRRNLIKAVK